MGEWVNGHIQLSVEPVAAGWTVKEWRWNYTAEQWQPTGRKWRFDDLDSAARFIKSYLF